MYNNNASLKLNYPLVSIDKYSKTDLFEKFMLVSNICYTTLIINFFYKVLLIFITGLPRLNFFI